MWFLRRRWRVWPSEGETTKILCSESSSIRENTEETNFTLIQDSCVRKNVFSLNERLLRGRGGTRRDEVGASLSEEQSCSSTPHVHQQKASLSFILLFIRLFPPHSLTQLSVPPPLSSLLSSSPLPPPLSSLLSSSPLPPPLSSLLSSSPLPPPPSSLHLNLSAALSAFICSSLLPPACLSLSSALQLSFVSTIFLPVQSGSAGRSGGTKQPVWTAHNFSSFDSDWCRVPSGQNHRPLLFCGASQKQNEAEHYYSVFLEVASCFKVTGSVSPESTESRTKSESQISSTYEELETESINTYITE